MTHNQRQCCASDTGEPHIIDCPVHGSNKNNPEINPRIKQDITIFCSASKVLGDGDSILCTYTRSHSGLHSFEDNHVYKAVPVLDHGYIRLVETWGRGDADLPEAAIVEAARQSTQGSFRGWEQDLKLLNTLYNSKPQHSGPFEFAGMTIEIQAPIFVFREWHRHRTQSYNEMSARYAPLPDLNYIPSVERLMVASSKNKQASAIEGAKPLDEAGAKLFQEVCRAQYQGAEIEYQAALQYGVHKELARVILPVGRYSRMRASANLRNWLAFLTLRADPNAQWEIQQYAAIVAQIISEEFPRTYGLYADSKRAH